MGQNYWFPAKQQGWGWRLPITWQGWAVFVSFLRLVVAGAWIFPPSRPLSAYIGYVVALSIALLIVCWLKGDPPHWRSMGRTRLATPMAMDLAGIGTAGPRGPIDEFGADRGFVVWRHSERNVLET
ncbi:MAG: hypothetical protein ACLPN5_16305 [Roseiarcus sp.]